MSLRGHGKTAFAHLVDRTGRLQLYFKADRLGEAYGLLALLDLGDWIGVEGHALPHAHGRGHGARGLVRVARQVDASAALGKEELDPDGRADPQGFADWSSATASATPTWP